jgi:DNA-directed RNA polymerase I, II, and III subunit RPABC1
MDPRAQQTVVEMLQQRGYIVQTDNDIIIGTHKLSNERIVVFYNSSSITISHIKEYIGIMNKTGFNHAILIYKENVTPQAGKTLEILTNTKEIEIFQEKSMVYNITKHRLVPIHRCLSRFECDLFKHKYGTKLPIILQTDVVSKFYNFKPGNIIEITRSDGIVVFKIVK